MSYARQPPQKKRGRNHESPERGKQQKEIICGHMQIPHGFCDKGDGGVVVQGRPLMQINARAVFSRGVDLVLGWALRDSPAPNAPVSQILTLAGTSH